MALSIKNAQVERLIEEIVAVTGESKTEAVRRSLEERKARLSFQQADGDRVARLLSVLEREVWPTVPDQERGRRLSREEEAAILGVGKDGV